MKLSMAVTSENEPLSISVRMPDFSEAQTKMLISMVLKSSELGKSAFPTEIGKKKQLLK